MGLKAIISLVLFFLVFGLLFKTAFATFPQFYGTTLNPLPANDDEGLFVSLWRSPNDFDPVANYTLTVIETSSEPEGGGQYMPLVADFDFDGAKEIFLQYDGGLHILNALTLEHEASLVFGAPLEGSPATTNFFGGDRKQILLITSNETSTTGGGNFTVIDYDGTNLIINFTIELGKGVNTTVGESPTNPIICKSGLNVSGVNNCYVLTADNQLFGFNATSGITGEPSFYSSFTDIAGSINPPGRKSGVIISQWQTTSEPQRIAVFHPTTVSATSMNISIIGGDGVRDMTVSVVAGSSNAVHIMNGIDWNGGSDKEIIFISELAQSNWGTGIGSSEVSIVDKLGNLVNSLTIQTATNPLVKDWDNDGNSKQEFAVIVINTAGKVFEFEVYEQDGGINKICDIPITDIDGTTFTFTDLYSSNIWTITQNNPQIYSMLDQQTGLNYLTIGDRILEVDTTGWSGGNCPATVNVTVVKELGGTTCGLECGWLSPFDDGADGLTDFIRYEGDGIEGWYIYTSSPPIISEEAQEQDELSNVAPTFVSLIPIQGSIIEGETITFEATVTDPEGDTIFSALDCDLSDGVQSAWVQTNSQTCFYPSEGFFIARFHVTDGRGFPARWGEAWFSNVSAFKDRNVTVQPLTTITCGDGICQPTESFSICAVDCPVGRTGNVGTPLSLDIPTVLVDTKDPFNSGLLPETFNAMIFLFSTIVIPLMILSLLVGVVLIGGFLMKKANK